jgi:predicted signal transduction protein with EAL and GGDEF domain
MGDRLGRVVGDFESAVSSTTDRSLTGSVFRVEGDEFVVVLEDIRSPRDATSMAEKILLSLEGPLHLEDREILLSMSIGIAFGPQGYREIEEILRDAQTAMHRAKVQGRARFEVFDREMVEAVQEELHLETELFQAMEARQFHVWYQPIFALESREIVGFEALARWEHPDRGLITPGHFIPLAEETGQIVRLSELLFEDAFP